MPEADNKSDDKKWTKKATEKVFAALNRADEIGGEVRDNTNTRSRLIRAT